MAWLRAFQRATIATGPASAILADGDEPRPDTSAPARDRRRLARAPGLPRAPEVDSRRRRAAVERARRLRELPPAALGSRAAGGRARRVGHAGGADLPARGPAR